MTVAAASVAGPEQMSPAIRIADPGAAYWIGQAILRLRREIAWQRQPAASQTDPAQRSLDLLRHDRSRRALFAEDPACRYLGERIAADEPGTASAFLRMAGSIGLGAAERFVLGLALAARVDGALGPVLAACQNDAGRPYPTLALAQSLWDEPLDVLAAQDPARPLLAFGLLEPPLGLADMLATAPGVARYLAGDKEPEAFGLAPVPAAGHVDMALVPLASRLAGAPTQLEIVPMVGAVQGDRIGLLGAIAASGARRCLAAPAGELRQALTVAWLAGCDLAVDQPLASHDEATGLAAVVASRARLPIRLYLHLSDRSQLAALPAGRIGPVVTLPETSAARRAELLRERLGPRARGCAGGIERAARNFRLEPGEIDRIAAGLQARPTPPTEPDLIAACRTECAIDFHGLAEPLAPRYGLADLILPPPAARHFAQALGAIRGSARVQHDWGGADRFGESGIALLFAGAPGTGKTMAAQVLAHELDLPLYRVDLSQIVNKYIGETEKNLKRVFDSAEKQRLILFFDEAEALFGKRTEVKDANDRFANVETGYLLQRMDAFTGVAILGTNRRKDIDEAFARRLRYVIEFPIPGPEERERIWTGVFPPGADLAALDLGFLARRFQLSGGHIRSIAFNASLQAAAREDGRAVTMADVLIATRRELDKLNRTSGREAFGAWYDQIEELRG